MAGAELTGRIEEAICGGARCVRGGHQERVIGARAPGMPLSTVGCAECTLENQH